MPDISAMASALNSIKLTIDIGRFIIDSRSTLEQAETNLKMAEISKVIFDVSLKVTLHQNEILELRAKILELKKELELKNSVVYERPYYWVNYGDNKKDGPYCQLCYDIEEKLIRLQEGILGFGYWTCKSCKSSVRETS